MKRFLFALAFLAATTPAFAQDHSGHMASTGDESAATEAYRAANMQMHGNMDIDYTGDADTDFILGMLPHHKGAVAMARIVLEHGSDPDVRKLAEEIIAAQEAEIAWMETWLAEHGHAGH